MTQWVKVGLLFLLVTLLSACDTFWNKTLELKRVSLQQMNYLVQHNDWLLVDARDSDWFNGWPSGGESEGGYIPGARNFDVAWIDAEQTLVDQLMNSKGMLSSRGIIVYGRDKQDAQVLAQWLVADLGFSEHKVRVYEDGFSGWVASGGAVEKLPGYERLVTAEWLEARRLATPELKILDVSWGSGIRYLASHIPGALHLDMEQLESEPLWNIRQADALEQALTSLGISYKTPVVVYGDDMMAAARVYFVLKYAGVKDVRLLNGGWEAWSSSGLPVERGFESPEPVASFGVPIPQNEHILSSTADVERIAQSSNEYLVSVRSWPEYLGQTSGYSYIKPKGRISGALWGRSGSSAKEMEDYLNPDNTLREYKDIASYWQRHDLEADDSIAFYCGTGWRASLAWFAATLMNFSDVSVYDGGWLEWSSDPSRPFENG